MDNPACFLLSVDLEDVRKEIVEGRGHPDRVPLLTERLLGSLADLRIKTTFFVVGEIALAHPSLIRAIVAEGHEVACHTHRHTALNLLNQESLRADLEENMDALMPSGTTSIRGFRAPFFSLVEQTEWAYEVLADLGFLYSSSVLPGHNPIFGWEGFGRSIRRMSDLWELPVTLSANRLLNVPFAGGVYFRVLPAWLTWLDFRRSFRRREAVVGYFHPQDFDGDQDPLSYANYNFFYNWLLNYNRLHCWKKLRKIIARGCRIQPYGDYVAEHLG